MAGNTRVWVMLPGLLVGHLGDLGTDPLGVDHRGNHRDRADLEDVFQIQFHDSFLDEVEDIPACDFAGPGFHDEKIPGVQIILIYVTVPEFITAKLCIRSG